MNKRDARRKAESETFEVSYLRALIRNARKRGEMRGEMSAVNPTFSLVQTCDIYEAALADRQDADTLPSRVTPKRDRLKLQNILRDCA